MQCSIREKDEEEEKEDVKIVVRREGKRAVKVPKKYTA